MLANERFTHLGLGNIVVELWSRQQTVSKLVETVYCRKRGSARNGNTYMFPLLTATPGTRAQAAKKGVCLNLRMSSGPWHGGYTSTGAMHIYSGPWSLELL